MLQLQSKNELLSLKKRTGRLGLTGGEQPIFQNSSDLIQQYENIILINE
jgi:hypothetical protein